MFLVWSGASRGGASPKWGWDFLVCCFSGHLLALPAAAGTAAASAASAAASAVCTYYVVIGGRFAPPYKYMVKYIQQKQQQKQQRQQHKNLLWQFIQLSIPLPVDA